MHKSTDAVTTELLQQLHDKVGGNDSSFAALFQNRKTGKPYTGGAYRQVELGERTLSEDFADAVLTTLTDALRLYGLVANIASKRLPGKDA